MLRYGYLLMQHRIHHLLQGQKLALVRRIPQSQAYLLTSVDVQAQEIPLVRIEFTERSHFPGSLPHDWFDQRGDFPEHQQGLGFSGTATLVLIFRDKGISLAHFGDFGQLNGEAGWVSRALQI